MKGVAVPYIIALILGIIILAIGTYLIYRAMNEGTLDCRECQVQFASWCSTCYLSEWQSEKELGNEMSECLNECGYWPGAASNQNCIGAEAPCKGVGVPL